VKRRALLSAVAAGSVAGCVSTSRVPPRVIGINGKRVTVDSCGQAVDRPCDNNDRINPARENWDAQKTLIGGVKAYYENGHVVIDGYITADSGSDSPDARISEVKVYDSKIFVSVHNIYNPIKVGPHPGVEVMSYKVRILNAKIYKKVKVVYYSEESQKKFSKNIHVE